jgi:hypothetical protein
MKSILIQRKMAVSRPEPESIWAIRVSHRALRKRGKGHISPRYLLRCGCCDQKVEIYYDPEDLEINGVFGSLENWREILLPLLGMKRKGKGFVVGATPREVPRSRQKSASRKLRKPQS